MAKTKIGDRKVTYHPQKHVTEVGLRKIGESSHFGSYAEQHLSDSSDSEDDSPEGNTDTKRKRGDDTSDNEYKESARPRMQIPSSDSEDDDSEGNKGTKRKRDDDTSDNEYKESARPRTRIPSEDNWGSSDEEMN